jgi:hypothetical protein
MATSIGIKKAINAAGGGRAVATGEGGTLWKLRTGRMVIETNGDPEWDDEPDFGEDAARIVTGEGRGLHYKSPQWRMLAALVDWEQIWPEVDCDGAITGRTVGDEEGFLLVDDEVVIAEDNIDCRWEENDGYAVPVTALIEAAVSSETIRGHGGIDEFAGLEHFAMNEACVAYRLAAANAIEDDARCGRLVVIAPRGERIVASGWSGSHWKHSAGAMGTMQRLTEDEQAALAAAHDAGLAAARAVIERADAEMAEAEGE